MRIYKTKATFVAPVGIGLALFVAKLVGVYWTGGALNPARAFAPAVIVGQFNGDHWIYWLGPTLGALLASASYALIKYLNYEEVNGDQDKPEDEEKNIDMAKIHRDRGNKETHHRHGSSGSHGPQRSQRSQRETYLPSTRARGHYQEYEEQRDFPSQIRSSRSHVSL